MSILIKNEMPKFCRKCWNCDFAGGEWFCVLELKGVEENFEETRPDWCPLIEVPPHGRLIDADALIKTLNSEKIPFNDDVNYFILNAPTITAEPIVRCKDCKHYEKFDGVADGRCDKGEYTFPNDFCSRGERKESEDDTETLEAWNLDGSPTRYIKGRKDKVEE